MIFQLAAGGRRKPFETGFVPRDAEAISAVREVSDEPKFLLSTLPPTPGQRWLAFAVAAILFLIFGVTTPFAATQLPRVDAFIPLLQGIFLVNDLITAVLLFSQFSIRRSYALLILASGYLFAALIVVPWALTFPEVFSPTGLLGAGQQTTGWLYNFWHNGFSAAVLAYAWIRDVDRTNRRAAVPARLLIGGSIAIVVSLVCALTWLATAGEVFLPPPVCFGWHLHTCSLSRQCVHHPAQCSRACTALVAWPFCA
jgi:hypothetical protein